MSKEILTFGDVGKFLFYQIAIALYCSPELPKFGTSLFDISCCNLTLTCQDFVELALSLLELVVNKARLPRFSWGFYTQSTRSD